MGALNFTWFNGSTPLNVKVKLLSAMRLKLLSWGGENWIGSESDVNKLEVLHSSAIQRISNAPMPRAKYESIRNIMIRDKFLNYSPIEDA